MDSIDSTNSLTVCKKVSHVLQITAVVAIPHIWRIEATGKMINCWVLGVPQFQDELCLSKEDNWLVVGPPLWKIWKSIGMISNPIYWKIKDGNQTTNQTKSDV